MPAPAPPGRRSLLTGVPVKRLAGFMGLPLISAAAPFLVLPVLLRYVGTEAWAGIAIGQSIGAGVSTLVLLGWPVVGPSAVAAAPGRGRALYTRSLISRLTVFVVAAPCGVALAVLLSPDGVRTATGLMALAMSMLGLSATWFFVGSGRPGSIARYETVPRVAATALAALLVSLHPLAWLYPAVLLLTSTVLTVVVSARYWERTRLTPLRTTGRVVRDQWAAVGVSVQAAVNTSLPLTILAAVAPRTVAAFAALDRITKFAVFALGPVGLAFQGWVAEPSESPARRRRTALVVTATAGLLLAGGFLLAAPPLLEVLFAGRIEVPGIAIVFAAVSIVCVALGTTLGFHHLVPLGMSTWLALSTAISMVVVTVSMVVLPPLQGVTGAALAIMLAEVSVVITQTLALVLRRSGRPVELPVG
ncbi:Membrane protein involved in the export of O-antigen and teichoic acid [Blastococcus aggregatus]|uniref:Membrane protein involved in the export of O-antigen and teichoic acid n=1 Tax=Blastococcus aggregatus TaxID=38502 RepID=A0A285V0P7_9ACTN|nr:hypothetical protein [Blastococcus aggregatus]SOC47735.1 Membrane protein involved in the export of O-antigen and teichoic acid [Blastococcus aggregatus]